MTISYAARLLIILSSLAFLSCTKSPVETSSLGMKLPAPQLKSVSPFEQEMDPQGYVTFTGTCTPLISSLSISLNENASKKVPAQTNFTAAGITSTKNNDVDCSDGKFEFYISQSLLDTWFGRAVADNEIKIVRIFGITDFGETESLVLMNTKPDSSHPTYSWTAPAFAGCTSIQPSWNPSSWGTCSAPQPVFSYGGWGACSASCGGGFQYRSETCSGTSGTQVRSVSCTATSGTEQRTPQCQRSDNVIVSDSYCDASSKPTVSQACSRNDCDTSSKPGSTQPCSRYDCTNPQATAQSCNTQSCVGWHSNSDVGSFVGVCSPTPSYDGQPCGMQGTWCQDGLLNSWACY